MRLGAFLTPSSRARQRTASYVEPDQTRARGEHQLELRAERFGAHGDLGRAVDAVIDEDPHVVLLVGTRRPPGAHAPDWTHRPTGRYID
jgi:hypothetical protein